LLCAVRLLEEREATAAGSLRRTAWSVREAFFLHCADISKRVVLLELAEEGGLPVSAIEDALGDGSAHAELCDDLEQARDQNIRASPTLVFNEGRQQLTGNVGYRIIEANVRELLEHPPDQHSWC
jgi:predicted DsbA family dithiol-disulfide isomerase